MASLQGRLQFWLAIYITTLLMALLLAGSHYIEKLMDDYVVDRLETDIEGILSAIVVEDGKIFIRKLQFSHIYDQPLSGHYFVIRSADGTEISSRSLWDYELVFPDVPPGAARINHLPGPMKQDLLVWVRGFRKDDFNFTLAVAEDHSHTHRQINRYIRNYAIFSFLGLIILLLVQRVIVRKSLRSLDDVRKDLKRLAEGEKRSLSEHVPREILPLVQETNHLLLLLSQRLERSRNSLGNLAHALKGPLSIVTQYFSDRANMRDARLFEQAGQQVQRIQELMERELRRARLVGRGISRHRFHPHVELPDLVGLLMQVHACNDVKLIYQVDDAITSFGDREDMHELMGNLLDNACKWARSRVSCIIWQDDLGVHIEIEDDGKGLTEDQLQKLTRRGVRLDESVEGHGLGLSIVKDIVRLYDGQIEFSRSDELGGLHVHVFIPGQEKSGHNT